MNNFPPQLAHGPLREVFSDIFYVQGETRPDFNGFKMCFTRSMTVLRDGNDLTLLNTIRLDEEGLAALDDLGRVRHVVKLGFFHGRDDAFYLDRYGASFWAAPGMVHERGEVTDHELLNGRPGPLPGSTAFAFETSKTPEIILHLERDGGILVSCDSLHNMVEPDRFFEEPTAQLMEGQGFFKKANVGPGWRGHSNPEAQDFARLKSLSFRHLLSAHGEPLLHSAHEDVSKTIADLYGV